MAVKRSIKILNARDVPISAVTVYTDRAEVTRTFNANLKPGLNEIQLENVSNSIEKDSIQVEGYGNATIHEVKFETKYINIENENIPKVKELKAEIKKLEAEVHNERDLQSVYNARIVTLDKLFGDGSASKEKVANPILSFDDTLISSINKFFEFHQEKCIEIKSKIRESEEKIKSFNAEINRLNIEINLHQNVRETKYVITIEAESEADNEEEVEFSLTYHVNNARWSAAYDIRVKSEKDQHQMILNYVGKITQKTGEDWNNVELSLSTAQPTHGGNLPKLGTTIVEIYRPPQVYNHKHAFFGGGSLFGNQCSLQMQQQQQPRDHSLFGSQIQQAPQQMQQQMQQPFRQSSPPPAIKQSVTVVEEDVLSTTFSIPSKKTIPSDQAEHKVTISIQNLTAYLHHHCVPKKNTSVYLMATVINDSDYPLISGPATVYLNNSLSTKIQLKAASCGEKFVIPLGIDRSLKVIYKPKHKFQTKSGMICKNPNSTTEQRIMVKNTKRAESVLITLHESIPKSTDEKVQVKVISPEITPNNALKSTNTEEEINVHKLPSVGAVLDDLNNLLWTEKIKAEHEKEFIVKWSIDYPPWETLRYSEQHQSE